MRREYVFQIRSAFIRKVLLSGVFGLMSVATMGQTVTDKAAAMAATNFFAQYANHPAEVEAVAEEYKDSTLCMYQVQFEDSSWCLVSSDFRVTPILAYGFAPIDTGDMPEGFIQLMEWYKTVIASLSDSAVTIDTLASNSRWLQLLSATGGSKYFHKVGNLLDETGRGKLVWGQGTNNNGTCTPSYNKYCPSSEHALSPKKCDCERKPVGCGAVAMGQIMWYWQWPRSSEYGVYEWDEIRNRLDSVPQGASGSTDTVPVAHLLRDCGRASNMMYTEFGSASLLVNIKDGFENKFQYKNVTKYERSEWTYKDSWKNLIKSELDNARPVLCFGQHGSIFNGHYFVIDGYEEFDEDAFFHVNWGHNGSHNAYCALDYLREVSSSATDTDTIWTRYNEQNKVIVGISPTYEDEEVNGLNYSTVPHGTKRTEYAYNRVAVPGTDQNLTVFPQGTFKVECGQEIVLQPGFEAKRGSEVCLHIDPNWQNGMEIELDDLSPSMGEEIEITTRNANSWEFQVVDIGGKIMYQNAGSIGEDNIAHILIDTDLPYGIYSCTLVLKNSYGRRLERQVTMQGEVHPTAGGDLSGKAAKAVAAEPNVEFQGADTELLVSPNPAEKVCHIRLQRGLIDHVRLYDMQGVLRLEKENVGTSVCELPLAGVARGTYLVVVESGGKLMRSKLIVI